MFSKDNKTSSQGQAPAAAAAPAPAPAPAPNRGHTPSIISADLKIIGNLECAGDIQVDGNVEGDIKSQTLTIGEGAEVSGVIAAEKVRVCGTVKGEIKATTVMLTKSARVMGDLIHDSLEIEAGAYLEGNMRRLESAGSSAQSGKAA